MIRGTHQLSAGVNVAQARSNANSYTNSAGSFSFNGVVTGLGLTDFLLGNVSVFTQAVPNAHYMRQSWIAFYGQDTWKMNPRLTLNYGLRWEPFLPQVSPNSKAYNFDYNRFQQGVRSSVFHNAPPGLYYPGDPGFPGQSGVNKRWLNFAPRVGLAWDASGDGQTSVRASY